MKKLVAILLLAACVNAAWAEVKRQANSGNTNSSAACTIESRTQTGYSPPKVIQFGDLKIKVVEEGDSNNRHYAIFDLKAGSYLKRGVRLTEGQIFSDTICGTEVSIQMRGSMDLLVSSF